MTRQIGGRRTRKANMWAKAAGEYYRSHKNDPKIKEFRDVLKSPDFKKYYLSKYGKGSKGSQTKFSKKNLTRKQKKFSKYQKGESEEEIQEEGQEEMNEEGQEEMDEEPMKMTKKTKKGKKNSKKSQMKEEDNEWKWGGKKRRVGGNPDVAQTDTEPAQPVAEPAQTDTEPQTALHGPTALHRQTADTTETTAIQST